MPIFSYSFFSGETPLIIAANKGDIHTMKKLISQNANVNHVAYRIWPHGGHPVLHYAIESGSVEAVKLLIEAGANVNEITSNLIIHQKRKQTNERNLFLLASAINSHAPINIIQALINGGADINKGGLTTGKWTPLMIASYRGYSDALKLLLKAGADKTIKNNHDGGRLAIDYAKEQGHVDIVKILNNK